MKQKPPHIDKELQTLMAMTLPEAMGKALESYNKFFDKDPDEGFSWHFGRAENRHWSGFFARG